MIDFQPFTAGERGRYELDRVWVKDGWRYASNGRVLIRAPAPDEPDTEGNFPDGASFLFARGFEACTVPLPPASGETISVPCTEEHLGVGECPECDGTGTCTCFSCDAEHDCGRCEGSGEREVKSPHPDNCVCGGTSQVSEPAPERIEGRLFAGMYLAKLRRLGGLRCCVESIDLGMRMGGNMLFIADEGVQGVLSGLRE